MKQEYRLKKGKHIGRRPSRKDRKKKDDELVQQTAGLLAATRMDRGMAAEPQDCIDSSKWPRNKKVWPRKSSNSALKGTERLGNRRKEKQKSVQRNVHNLERKHMREGIVRGKRLTTTSWERETHEGWGRKGTPRSDMILLRSRVVQICCRCVQRDCACQGLSPGGPRNRR